MDYKVIRIKRASAERLATFKASPSQPLSDVLDQVLKCLPENIWDSSIRKKEVCCDGDKQKA